MPGTPPQSVEESSGPAGVPSADAASAVASVSGVVLLKDVKSDGRIMSSAHLTTGPLMARTARGIARSSGLLVAAIALAVLVGWVANWPLLKGFTSDAVPMNPVVALTFLIAAASLWIFIGIEAGPSWRSRWFAQGLSWIVVILAVQRLIAYALDWPSSIDQLLFGARLAGNRMAPTTAVSFAMMGLALAGLDVEVGRWRQRPAVWLSLLAGAIGLVAVTGYLYGVEEFYGPLRTYLAMAPNTAACFVLLMLGILCARPQKEPVSVLVSRTSGGTALRRLLPAAVIVPLILGWMRLKGQHLGVYDTEFGVALFAVATVVVLIVMTYVSSRSLLRTELRRMQAETALSRSEAFYHSLVETIPQHIFRKDLAGRFTFANTRFCNEIGRPLDQIVGKTDFDFFPPDLAARYRRDDQEVIRTGQPLDVVEEHVTPGGRTLYVQVVKTAVYDDSGRVIGSQAIFWDVTEKKRAQTLLEESNRQLAEAVKSEHSAHEARKAAQSQVVQAEKLAAIWQMVAGVAHEINNPLAFVNNNVAVIQRDVAGLRRLLDLYRQADGSLPAELAAEIAELAGQIDIAYTVENLDGLFARSREGMRRIQQIVKDLRDFARLDESDLQEADLGAGIESTVNIVQGYARRKGVKVVTQFGTLPKVTCQAAKINQIVMNLLTNAIDASKQGCEVTVSTRVDGAGAAAMAIIEVRDTGHGIPPAIRDRIFDPFFTTKPQGQGTGLGLSISYGIIKDHGGTIEVDSEVEKGSTFRVKLPVDGKPGGEKL